MKAIKTALIFTLFASMQAGASSLASKNCQAQAGGTTTAKNKQQIASEYIRVFQGDAKATPKQNSPAASATREKGS